MPEAIKPRMEVVGAVATRSVAIALCVLMMLAALGALALTPNRRLADISEKIDLETAIPQRFGDWKIDTTTVPIPPSPSQKETLELIYDQIVSRTYVNSKGERMMLSVTYGSSQTKEMRAHRQEVCYAAQGFQISELKEVSISFSDAGQIPVTRMVAKHQYRTEPVTYWFTMGDMVVRSYVDRQIAQMKYALSGLIPDGYLFRVSSINTDSSDAFTNQVEFSSQILNAMDKRLAAKLLGGVATK